jgi:hypothetical protein
MLPAGAGLQRFTWDLRCPGFRTVPDENGESDAKTGYLVPPGEYTVRLRCGERALERRFGLRADPRVRASREDLVAQYGLLVEIRDKLSEVNAAIARVRRVRAQLASWGARVDLDAGFRERAAEVARALGGIEEQLTQPKADHDTDRLKLPGGLDAKLGDLPNVVASADAAPTRQAVVVFRELRARTDSVLASLREILEVRVAALNAELARAAVPIIDTSLGGRSG